MIQEKQETSWKKILKQEGISNGIQVILVRCIEGHQGPDRESKKLGGGGLSSRCHYQSLRHDSSLEPGPTHSYADTRSQFFIFTRCCNLFVTTWINHLRRLDRRRNKINYLIPTLIFLLYHNFTLGRERELSLLRLRKRRRDFWKRKKTKNAMKNTVLPFQPMFSFIYTTDLL